MGWGEPQTPKTPKTPVTPATSEAIRGAIAAKRALADPDTTLDGKPFVGGEPTEDAVIDVFAVVAAYDHEVGNPTAPEYATYEAAREAGIELLKVNENVISFRIDKRTTRKA